MSNNKTLSVFADRHSPETHSMTLMTSVVFIGFVPFVLLVVLYYMSRKTDNRLPQSAIHTSLIWLSGFCNFGSITLTIMILILQSVQYSTEKDIVCNVVKSLLRGCSFFLMNGPLILFNIFYYLLFLSAFQRILLIARFKLGMRLLTGRRLRFKIFISILFALILSINRIVCKIRVPWTVVVTLIVTLILYLFCAFMVQHIERRIIASNHITVLVQTVPLTILLSLFTIGDYFVTNSGQKKVTTQTFRIVSVFTMSLMTPFFLIIGSWAKRRVVLSIITCQNEIGRGELYTSERTVETSNAVSMTPTTRF